MKKIFVILMLVCGSSHATFLPSQTVDLTNVPPTVLPTVITNILPTQTIVIDGVTNIVLAGVPPLAGLISNAFVAADAVVRTSGNTASNALQVGVVASRSADVATSNAFVSAVAVVRTALDAASNALSVTARGSLYVRGLSVPVTGNVWYTFGAWSKSTSNNIVQVSSGFMPIVVGDYDADLTASISGINGSFGMAYIAEDGTNLQNCGASSRLTSSFEVKSTVFSCSFTAYTGRFYSIRLLSDTTGILGITNANFNMRYTP